MQLFDDCQAVLAATLHALIGGKTVDLPFDIEQGIDPFDGLQCHWRDRRSFVATFGVRADVGQHEELAAYWLREPQPNTSVLAYQGCVAPEVLTAAGQPAERHRDVAVLAVTTSDRLNAGWTAAQRARRHGYGAAVATWKSCSHPYPASPCDNRHRWSSGNTRLARLGSWSCADQLRRGAFLPDRDDRRSLYPFRHRYLFDHRSGGGSRSTQPSAYGKNIDCRLSLFIGFDVPHSILNMELSTLLRAASKGRLTHLLHRSINCSAAF